MRFKKILSLAAAFMLTAAMLAGCTAPAEAPAPGAASQPEAPQESSSGGAQETPQDASGIQRGGTMVARRIGITPINPMETIAPTIDKMVYGLFIEGLVASSEEDFSVVPALAESWELSADGLTLDMKLREGVIFHDGDPLNAEAVVKTWELYRNPDKPHIQISLAGSLSGVEAVSEYVVRFSFDQPDSAFLKSLTTPLGYVFSPSSIEKYLATNDPEIFAREGGTGPFVLTELVDGEYYLGERFDSYYQMGEDGQPLPYLDGVMIQIVADETVLTANMRSGDIHVADSIGTTTQLDILRADEACEVRALPMGCCYFLYMNTSKAPFDNIKVREALCYAVDRQELIDVINQGTGWMVPSIVWDNQFYYKDYPIYSYDPEKAKALLAEAGYADGVTVELYYGNYGIMEDECELIQAQAKAAGFDIKLVGVDGATVKQIWALENAETPAGLRLQDNGTPKSSPYVQFEYIFGGNALQNCSKWLNPRFQELLSSINSVTDEAEQLAMLHEMQDLIVADIPIVPLQSAPDYTAYRAEAVGLYWDGDASVYFTKAWLND
ncbi:MAG: ABC transporter substrate-binding protein [Clostridia bacterium]|nr:ABC transporter substrate-binding protein [Clostridia bacterium]